MSERIPGKTPPPPTPVRARDAAAVILVRGAHSAREVYWLKREQTLAFAGGFYAFPGGRLDAQDHNVPVDGADGMEAALRVTAARELFEETGVLVARGAERLPGEVLQDARKKLNEKTLRFSDFLAQHQLTVKATDFIDAGRWLTPTFLPLRFDARFFLVEAPPSSKAENWPGEAAEAAWVKPEEALKRWQAGTALLHPPNLHILQVLRAAASPADQLTELRQPLHCPNGIATRIEFQQGIRLFPLETPTLPPATHTNCYILGNGELLIVDPGAAEVRQYARLLAVIAGLQAEGKRPKAVLLTHQHVDHIGGAVAVKERLRIPIWAHEITAERLDFRVQRTLADEEVLTLAGLPPMKLRVLHTPGHARGHISLVDEASKAGIVGDMVSGLSTIVIDPPEGDMTDYLAQLKRLRDLPVGTLYPAHGPALPDGVGKLNEYLRHRELRERRVFEALPASGTTLQQLVTIAYADVPPEVHPIAERSALAILLKLMREGRILRQGDKYAPIPPAAPAA